MQLSRILTSTIVACTVGIAPIVARAATSNIPPQPVPTPPPMGYYIMQGRQIVSMPFPDPNSCIKMLLKIQKTVAPGNDTLVCARRHP